MLIGDAARTPDRGGDSQLMDKGRGARQTRAREELPVPGMRGAAVVSRRNILTVVENMAISSNCVETTIQYGCVEIQRHLSK